MPFDGQADGTRGDVMTKFLVGKTINGIKVASDKKAILFECADGSHLAKADGDCCSSTWVEHIEVPDFPCTVTGVEDIEMPDLGSPGEDGVIAYYGCKISTDRGEIVIDYRNESNGYYGGNLVWPDEKYFDGGVFGQNVSNEEWRPL